ncbi:MAG TPA: alpha/beta hydrolase [Solirubrobacterales bacterium]|jgi:pimeloyl-ACP methyl ester carboxylesterase
MAERVTRVNDQIELCHESFGDPVDPPLLLVMGLGMQMVGWHDEFCAQLAARGFHVVRFDNRDAGRSTHLDFRPPTLRQLATRRFAPEQYTIEDMAADTAGLIDALELGPVHVVGASMGGMIAQMLAARHPDRVRSLVSIMSNTGSRFSGQPDFKLLNVLLRASPREREAFIDHSVRIFELIGSRELGIDVEEIREQAARSYERGHSPAGTGRQLGAILKSGNRTRALRGIRVPTTVIHGTRDRLVKPSGGRATARAIRDARLIMLEGMGHDLPRVYWDRIIDAIAANAARAGEAPRGPAVGAGAQG